PQLTWLRRTEEADDGGRFKRLLRSQLANAWVTADPSAATENWRTLIAHFLLPRTPQLGLAVRGGAGRNRTYMAEDISVSLTIETASSSKPARVRIYGTVDSEG